MPAWPKLKVRVLADLAEQLRFAPRSAVVKDIGRAVRTIDVIDPSQSYPGEWVVFRVTGYRGEERSGELATIPGALLRAEWPRFVERLCAQSRLRAEDLASFGPGISQAELLARWNVNRKTLERYRSKGLLALRVLGLRGRSELLFPAAVVGRYEKENAPALRRARVFSRVDASGRERIARRAAKLAARAKVSRSRLAAHLARRTGRAKGTIARLIPPSRAQGRAASRQGPSARARLLEAWDRGAGVGDLARRARKSRAAIIRSLSLARAVRIENWDPSSRVPRAKLAPGRPPLAAIAGCFPLAAEVATPAVESDLGSLLDSMSIREIVPPERERELVLAHHALVSLAARSIGGARSVEALDTAETALRWVFKLRAELVRAHRAVIIESIGALAGPSEPSAGFDLRRLDPAVLVSALAAGVSAASGAIEQFTPLETARRGIGGRLAAPVGLAVGKALAEWAVLHAEDMRRAGERTAMGRAVRSLEAIGAPDWAMSVCPWTEALSPMLRADLSGLPADVAEILMLRDGRDATRPHSIGEIAERIKVTRARAAERVQAALRACSGR